MYPSLKYMPMKMVRGWGIKYGPNGIGWGRFNTKAEATKAANQLNAEIAEEIRQLEEEINA